jgi:hypothetical protein
MGKSILKGFAKSVRGIKKEKMNLRTIYPLDYRLRYTAEVYFSSFNFVHCFNLKNAILCLTGVEDVLVAKMLGQVHWKRFHCPNGFYGNLV